MQRLNGGAKEGQAYIEEIIKKEDSKVEVSSDKAPIVERLAILKSLFDDDLITESEYIERKKEILSDI